ncbi:MAG: DNA polymerase Y family protein, partial [Siculibacillus sp.]|nr:DNA polymerase Y family protein [Siculibacillus sp.]
LATVDDLLALPRGPLARRFGADLLVRLDEATGRAERPISPRLPVAAVTAERRFFEPISTPEDVAAVTRSLAGAIAESLERRGEGATLVELALWRVDGDVRRLRVGTGRPVRDAELLLSLFAERLKGEGGEPARGRRGRGSDSGFRIACGMEPGYGFDLVRLSVAAAVPLDPAQIDLSGDAETRVALDRLIDRLGARLGSRRVGVALPGDAHVPEEACRFRPAGEGDRRAADLAWGLAADDGEEPPARPVRLLDRPEPIDTVAEIPDGPPLRFRWRRVLYEVTRAEGPERIAPPWWRAPPEASLDPELPADAAPTPGLDPARATRDYFRVEDAAGRRFWIFRAGLFGRETIRPRWFVHGLFA